MRWEDLTITVDDTEYAVRAKVGNGLSFYLNENVQLSIGDSFVFNGTTMIVQGVRTNSSGTVAEAKERKDDESTSRRKRNHAKRKAVPSEDELGDDQQIGEEATE